MGTQLPGITVTDPGTKEQYDVPLSFFDLGRGPTNVSFYYLNSTYAPSPGAPAIFEGSWNNYADVVPGSSYLGQASFGEQVTRTSNIWSFPSVGIWRITNKAQFQNDDENDLASNLWFDFNDGTGFAGTSTQRKIQARLLNSVSQNTDIYERSMVVFVTDIATNGFRWFFNVNSADTEFGAFLNSILFERLGDLPS